MADRYDVFVSFKNLDGQGRPTRDSELARVVFDHLTSQNLSVFFSNVALERAGEAAFKRAIDDALDRSETLVAVGTSKQNLESRWVRYEWDSFYTDILSSVKPEGRMFTYVEGMQIQSLPRTLRQSQMIEHGEGSLERLYRFIANGLRGAKKESKSNPFLNSLLDAAGKTLPKVSQTDASSFKGAPRIGEPLIGLRTSRADIEKDPSLSNEDKKFLQLMWDVAESDKQREELINRLTAIDRERGPSTAKLREAALQELELRNRQRETKLAEIKEIQERRNEEIRKLFK